MNVRRDVPLGYPAKAELRMLRGRVHTVFDPLWKDGILTRSQAYAWLARGLGIPIEDCPVSQFMEEQARLAFDATVSIWNYRGLPVPTRRNSR